MKSLNTKLVLSALAIAMIASPAFAQRPHQAPSQSQYQPVPPANGTGTYPNPVARSGSAYSVESGEVFNTGY